jgi:hypothetical protein
VRSRPPSVKPATRPDPPGPSAHRSLGSDRHRGKWGKSGGAGRIGSKRLDPGAPTTPRLALPAGRGPAVGDTRLPLPRGSRCLTGVRACLLPRCAVRHEGYVQLGV